MLDTVRKITGSPVVLRHTRFGTAEPERRVRVYGDITDTELQAYAAQTTGDRPDSYDVHWPAA